ARVLRLGALQLRNRLDFAPSLQMWAGSSATRTGILATRRRAPPREQRQWKHELLVDARQRGAKRPETYQPSRARAAAIGGAVADQPVRAKLGDLRRHDQPCSERP